MPDIRLSIPAAPVVLPLALLAAVLVLRQPGQDVRLRIWRLAAVLYCAGLLTVTFFPFDVALGPYAASKPWWQAVNAVPLLTIDPETFLLNVVMTAPLTVLAAVLTGRTDLARAVRLAFLVSLGIETMQLALGTLLGASRSADVNDLLANTLGGLLGWTVMRVASRFLETTGVMPTSWASRTASRRR